MDPIAHALVDTLEEAMQLTATLTWAVEMNGGMSSRLEAEIAAAIAQLRGIQASLLVANYHPDPACLPH